MNNEIYPNAELDEIIANAKKSSAGTFYRQYRKGDFLYTTEKKPFSQRNTVAVHVPTKTVFFYDPMFLEWVKLNKKFTEF